MHSSSPSRFPGLFLFVAFGASIALRAQNSEAAALGDAMALDQFVVSASRTPQDPWITPSSVSLLSFPDLERSQVSDLRVALSQQPGVVVLSTGAVGGPTSIFLRGSSPHQTLLVVDGVRMNDRAASYGNYLGSADLGGIGHLEVLRGPQSTLYGSSAMGGVILLETTRGTGPYSGAVTGTAGSFDTYGASVRVSGASSGLSVSGSLARLQTENDHPLNRFRQWSYSTRLEYAATPRLLVGATFRGQNGDYEEPGSRLFAAVGVVSGDNYLTTAYAQLQATDTFVSKITLGAHRRLYTYASAYGDSNLDNTRKILDWQNTWQVSREIELVAGVNYERSAFTVNGVRSSDVVSAGYVSATAHPFEKVTLTGGLRYDHFKSAGSATTWRAGLAWRPVTKTKLHATVGTGFSAPGSDDRYGVPEFGQLPNLTLQPEKSRGWDAGIDQEFATGRATLSATYFHNRFRNLFEWEYVDFVTYQGRIVNRASATTSGVELALAGRLGEHVRGRVAYTYLEAKDNAGKRLIRRPRHVIDAELSCQPVKAWSLGLGVHGVADRVDAAATMEDYTTARIFTRYALRENLLLKARVENALNERFEEVLGYASLPRGVYGSVEWRF